MLNRISLIGYVYKDPVKKEIGDNIVCEFRLRVTRDRGKADSKGYKPADWFDIECWGSKDKEGLPGTVMKYVHDKSKVFVSGAMQSSTDEKRKTTYWRVRADKIEFLDSKEDRDAEGNGGSKPVDRLEPIDDDSDIPF